MAAIAPANGRRNTRLIKCARLCIKIKNPSVLSDAELSVCFRSQTGYETASGLSI